MQQEYDVEKIVGRRVRKGKVEFRVKWVGYANEENTWELETSLKRCVPKIEKFMNEQRLQEQPAAESAAPKTPPRKSPISRTSKAGRKRARLGMPAKRQSASKRAQSERPRSPSVSGSGSDATAMETEYVVESVVGRRVKAGKLQYFIKWKNYPAEQNTWEPLEHLHCPELIAAYEHCNPGNNNAKSTTKRSNSSQVESPLTSAKIKAEQPDVHLQNSVKKERPHKSSRHSHVLVLPEKYDEKDYNTQSPPTRITGATDRTGKLMFLVRWANGHERLMTASIANVKWPQLVIRFYESRITWGLNRSFQAPEDDDDAKRSKGSKDVVDG